MNSSGSLAATQPYYVALLDVKLSNNIISTNVPPPLLRRFAYRLNTFAMSRRPRLMRLWNRNHRSQWAILTNCCRPANIFHLLDRCYSWDQPLPTPYVLVVTRWTTCRRNRWREQQREMMPLFRGPPPTLPPLHTDESTHSNYAVKKLLLWKPWK